MNIYMSTILSVAKCFTLAIIVLSSFVVLPSTAFASGYVTPGSEWIQAAPGANLLNNDMIGVYMEKDRSYSCVAIGFTVGLSSNVITPNSQLLVARNAGEITPGITTIENRDDNRLTLTPTMTGVHTLQFLSDKGAEPARVECIETTLYGGYNTNVNDFNFLELNNLTNATIKGAITAINWDGAVVVNKKPFSLNSNRRMDVDLHSAVGNNMYGMVIVTHDGPYGAIQGAVSQYRGSVSNFEIAVSNPLKPREQKL